MNQWLADHFKAGEYYEAIDKNIQLYAEAKLLDHIKKGVMDALLVHQANGLITDSQRKALIKNYKLDGFDKNLEKDKDRKEAVSVVHGQLYTYRLINYMDANKEIEKIETQFYLVFQEVIEMTGHRSKNIIPLRIKQQIQKDTKPLASLNILKYRVITFIFNYLFSWKVHVYYTKFPSFCCIC